MPHMFLFFFFFFFKQKTAYEMRISDWSSDVCSSDLRCGLHRACPSCRAAVRELQRPDRASRVGSTSVNDTAPTGTLTFIPVAGVPEIAPGNELAAVLEHTLARQPNPTPQNGDAVVVSQETVSQAAARRSGGRRGG